MQFTRYGRNGIPSNNGSDKRYGFLLQIKLPKQDYLKYAPVCIACGNELLVPVEAVPDPVNRARDG
jgi:hypothetical protein